MNVFKVIVFSTFYLFLKIVLADFQAAGEDECYRERETRCGENGPAVRFPFRLKDRQPAHCGYPGFDLHCTGANHTTALELPNIHTTFFVREIDYAYRYIVLYNPEKCWFRKQNKQFLNLSVSPFPFPYEYDTGSTLFNCSPNHKYSSDYGISRVSCLSDHGYSVWVTNSGSDVSSLLGMLVSCRKMFDMASVRPEFYSGSDIRLTWSEPNCHLCEEKGKRCRLKKNSTKINETECFKIVPKPRKGSKNSTVTAGPLKSIVLAGSIVGSFLILVLVIGTTTYIYNSDKKDRENRLRIKKFLEDYMAFNPSRYTYSDIKKITEQLKDMLGQGAYGTVFKGKLSNDIYVAVKILNNTKRDGEEFINEVATMGRIHHVNVVRLVGFCADGFKRALVYEFLPNGSLEKYISSQPSTTNHSLSWEKLQEIALGIAKGIEYLHQGCDQRILHFDIKPHNVLLDQNFSPKIADFGLAKLCSKDQSIVSMTTARGTMGYIAPEVFSRNFGSVSYKSDVYSFGMLLLEMVGGRKNIIVEEEQNNEEIYYPEWIYNLLEEGEDLRIQIEEEEDAKIAKKLAIVGLWCIQWHPVGRPTMKVVVRMLEGSEELSMPPNPFASSGPSNTTSKRPPARRSPLELEAIAE